MRRRPATARWRRGAVLVSALLLGGCSVLTNFDDATQTEDSFQHCRDDSDNDNDGLVDCDDLDCVAFSFCEELTPAACSNGKDDDADGAVDCQDKGCKVHEAICSERTLEACTNEQDDDGDGLADCKDPDCRTLKVCQEATAAACADKVDNDSDGLVDCLDFDCFDSRESCCKIPSTGFTGDKFTFKATCKNDPCPGGPACCSGLPAACCKGVFDCSAFDPARWVVWGWPRPRLEQSGFTVNEPCSCESSGIVSVDQVHLFPQPESVKKIAKGAPVLRLKFKLSTPSSATAQEQVCAGITTDEIYPNTAKQCSTTNSGPRLLAGVCLRLLAGSSPDAGPPDAGPPDARPPDSGSPDAAAPDSGPPDAAAPDAIAPDAGADAGVPDAAAPHMAADLGTTGKRTVRVIIDGQVMLESAAASAGAISGTVEISQAGIITATAGATTYSSQTGISPTLTTAKVVVLGHGAAARLTDLEVLDNGAPDKRCQDPRAWDRHLARGAPVIQAAASAAETLVLVEAREPSVVHNALSGKYLMAFAGRAESRKDAGGDAGVQVTTESGIFWAKSDDGVSWVVHDTGTPGGTVAPVVRASSPSALLGSPDILIDNNTLHMWYGEQSPAGTGPWTIRHAISNDGLTWTLDQSAGAGLAPAGGTAWDAYSVNAPSVVKRPDGAGFYMWYAGTARATGARPAIGLATSTGGSVWKRVGKAALIAPKPGGIDLALEDPEVIWDSTLRLYRMWHTYRSFSATPTLRYAVSVDGTTWVPWPKGAALSPGPAGSFDERGVSAPAARAVESRVKLWYVGLDANNKLHIGYAENRGSR